MDEVTSLFQSPLLARHVSGEELQIQAVEAVAETTAT